MTSWKRTHFGQYFWPKPHIYTERIIAQKKNLVFQVITIQIGNKEILTPAKCRWDPQHDFSGRSIGTKKYNQGEAVPQITWSHVTKGFYRSKPTP